MPSLLPEGFSWRSRALWLRGGYAATSLWMIAVLVITRQDPRHPLFQLIFIVPLAGWILGIAAAKLIKRLWPPPADDGARRP